MIPAVDRVLPVGRGWARRVDLGNAASLSEEAKTVSESERLIDDTKQPTMAEVADLIGAQNAGRWSALLEFIDTNYPGIFAGEWLYGGKKHGWTLRFKKSKSFCTLVPERGRMKVLIVFGAAEREKAEAVLPMLTSHAREDYLRATTYHDGKWVLIDVDGDDVQSDVQRLLEIKRRPRR